MFKLLSGEVTCKACHQPCQVQIDFVAEKMADIFEDIELTVCDGCMWGWKEKAGTN